MMEVDGPPVYDVTATYLRNVKRLRINPAERVRVV
jgi:hypothetical protein